jgi:hypothetical protein
MQIADAVAAKGLNGRDIDPHEAFALDIAQGHWHDDDRRKHEGDPGQFQGGEIEPAQRGDGRIDTRANLQRKRGYAGKIDGGQRDCAWLHPLKAEAPQARRGQQQARAALSKRLERRNVAGVEGFDAKRQKMGAASFEDDRTTCAHLAESALDSDLSKSSLRV